MPFSTKSRICCICAGVAILQPAFGEQIIVPTDQPTIQAAIDAAVVDDIVIAEPGTYNENITLKSGVDVRGREASRTFIDPGGDGTAVQANAVTGVLLANFTILNAAIGIDVIDSSDLQIANNIVDGLTQFGVRVDADSTTDILHNVFWQNFEAVRRDTDDIPVTNNIFAGNTRTITPIQPVADPNANVEYNCFFDNQDLKNGDVDTSLGTNSQIGDPLFVDVGIGDFHLRENSPCIDTGTGADDIIDNSVADSGAYGGEFADVSPYPVAAPSLADASPATQPPYNVDVSWDANLAYLVTNSANPGSYRVYYQQNQPGPPYNGTDADGGAQPSPLEAGDNTTLRLVDLQPTVLAPPVPQLLSAEPRSNAMALTWTAVAEANAYSVHYGIGSISENQVEAGNVTGFTVGGLQDGVTYLFAVSALAQPVYHVSVTALDNTQNRNESEFLAESTIMIGPFFESFTSNELTATPSETTPVPDLPDDGCFVATAAFGADWMAEVQVLRDLRDQYLLVNRPGRVFVDWYYTYGPVAADFITEYGFLKPLVRLLLLPFVVFALFVIASSLPTKMILTTLLILLTIRRRQHIRRITAPRPGL
ncbi:MAG: CFI-box-CTERM domain-containing protein [Woeseiaceae bacterium]